MTILDNQEVNADILNGIAKDLGCPDFSEFVNDEKFGADKLNSITAALVTPGVLGTGSEDCKCSIVDGMVSIGTGTIVFANGAKMKIAENQLLEIVQSTKTYVIAVNDITNNKMLLYNSDVLPDEDDYVLLAEVSATGELIDKRAWSTAKVAGEGGPVYERFNEEVNLIAEKDGSETLSKVIRLTRSGYHCIVVPFADMEAVGNPQNAFVSFDGEWNELISCYLKNTNRVRVRLVYDGKSTVEVYTSRPTWAGGTTPRENITTLDIYFF